METEIQEKKEAPRERKPDSTSLNGGKQLTGATRSAPRTDVALTFNLWGSAFGDRQLLADTCLVGPSLLWVSRSPCRRGPSGRSRRGGDRWFVAMMAIGGPTLHEEGCTRAPLYGPTRASGHGGLSNRCQQWDHPFVWKKRVRVGVGVRVRERFYFDHGYLYMSFLFLFFALLLATLARREGVGSLAFWLFALFCKRVLVCPVVSTPLTATYAKSFGCIPFYPANSSPVPPRQ